jgi:indolepyruvate decarboxylase
LVASRFHASASCERSGEAGCSSDSAREDAPQQISRKLAQYTVERTILGKPAKYNDVANWAYAELPKVFRRDTNAKSIVAETVEELGKALAEASGHDDLVFIESVMDKYDSPEVLIAGGHCLADLDYGPHGPQHRDDIQI